MIIRDRPNLLDLLFAWRGSVLPHILRPVLGLVAVSTAMVWLDNRFGLLHHADATAFTVFGIALSLFLGFRNNAGYDRWWEARKLWGGLLSDLRNLAREAKVFIPDDALRHQLLRQSLAFLHLHRAQLRRLRDDPECDARAPDLIASPNPPCACLDRMSDLLALAHRDGRLDGFGARSLTGRLASMATQQAACERIATTPLPYVYSLLIYRTTYLFCLLLPLALIGPAGWLTPLFIGIVGYVFLGLAEVSEEMSHPFGPTLNALPLDALCRSAEISLAPHLDEAAPKPLQPLNYYLQ